jgi:hypothetical protein
MSVFNGQYILRYIYRYRVKRESHVSDFFFQESAEGGSIENLQSDTSSPAEEVNGSSGTNYIPVPRGWCTVYDEDSGELCYINIATGVKVCCKSSHVTDCWKW